MDHFTDDEIHRLLEAAREHRERDWLMILVAYLHGLRASEVTALTTDSVQDDSLAVRRLKGSYRTLQPLVHHADPLLDERKALNDFVKKSKAGTRLFPIRRVQFWKLVQKYGRIAKIPRARCHPHALKHTTAMHGLRSMTVNQVQKYLGHKSLASTGKYLEADERKASEAFADAIGAGRPHQRRLII